MPELPEVETTRRGIEPHILGQRVSRVCVRQPRLRWPVSPELARSLPGQRIQAVERRAKYLLLHTGAGSLIIHLGMSGSLRLVAARTPAEKHDHVDIVLAGGTCLRYRDPRRFGALLWSPQGGRHPLLQGLGPEPLSADFHGDHLYRQSRKRRCAIKTLIMNNAVVVGVGNIYANEALFLARIHPERAAGRLGRESCQRLAQAIKQVLAAAIEQGGTTLRDFTASDGQPGYFAQQLHVYGKAGQPCPVCGHTLRGKKIGQRASHYCPHCQR